MENPSLASVAAVRPLTSARSYGVAPTRAAVRWLRDVLVQTGQSSADGVVELGTQRELATLSGRSPGTVWKYLGLLGDIVVASVPVRVDLDLLDSPAASGQAADTARPRQPTPPPGDASADLVAAVAQLLDSVTNLLATATRADGSIGERHESASAVTGRVRRASARLRAPSRAVSRTKVARRGAQKARVSQTDRELDSPVEQDLSDCLSDDARRAPRAVARPEMARNGAPAQSQGRPASCTPVGGDVLSDTEVGELVAPLVEACRRCHRPQNLDRDGYAALRVIPSEGLRYAVSQIVLMLATTDKVRSPMGLLVAKARAWAEGDTDFFEAPSPPAPPLAPDPVLPSTPATEEDDEDPLTGLSDEDLAAIDRTIAGARTMPARALHALRREHARMLQREARLAETRSAS